MDELLYQTEMEYTYDNYLKLSLFHFGKKSKLKIIKRILLIFIIVFGFLSAVFALLIGNGYLFLYVLFIIYLIVAISFMTVLNKFLAKLSLKKTWKTSKYLQEISFLRYEFYEDHMIQITSFGTLNFPYYLVNKVYESNEFFCFMLVRNQEMFVEKAQCSDELIQFIREKVMKKIA